MVDETSVQQVLDRMGRTPWILTAQDGGTMGGLVATFVNNASLVPALPRLTIGIARHHHTWGLIRRSRAFAAHLVDEPHVDLIWRFGLASGRDTDKFEGLEWHGAGTGSPVLGRTLAWLDCRVEAELDIGDRTIFVAAIVDGALIGPGDALTMARVLELATPPQLRRMRAERERDEQIDAAAIRAWRAAQAARE